MKLKIKTMEKTENKNDIIDMDNSTSTVDSSTSLAEQTIDEAGWVFQFDDDFRRVFRESQQLENLDETKD